MKRDIHVDLLGLGHLLKSVQYLLFPAAMGVDLLRTLVGAEVEARAMEAQAEERPAEKRCENAKPER